MLTTRGYAAQNASAPLAPFSFERRELKPNDVLIEILYCGICHSDIHSARNEWRNAIYPMVPGHEIVGRVTRVGSQVTHYKEGDLAGVGCMVNSCQHCTSCQDGLEQHCTAPATFTYNSLEADGKTVTYGGYSAQIVVDEKFVLKVPKNLPLERVAPLLCAGITTYSPLRQWGIGKGHHIAVVGLGGLGHMGVKIGVALGAHVTVLSTSPNKQKDAESLGAHAFAVTRDEQTFVKLANSFDLILDTVSAAHDLSAYLNLLKYNGTLVLVGAPTDALKVEPFSLIFKRAKLSGSLIGGIAETQEMLDFCSQHNIAADVEVIAMQDVNKAYERMLKGDVHYRFVIDMKTL